MDNPALIVPGALDALPALGKVAARGGLPQKTSLLVVLRASQINGCSVCAHMHARDAKKAGETDDRLATVAAWSDAPFFSDAERAAMALTEAVTRLSDQADPVPDAIFDEAAKHYDQQALQDVESGAAPQGREAPRPPAPQGGGGAEAGPRPERRAAAAKGHEHQAPLRDRCVDFVSLAPARGTVVGHAARRRPHEAIGAWAM